MTFLPIVDRELRVAARRKSTHWIRLVTTLIAATISFFFLIFASIVRSPTSAGGPLFYTLTIYAFGLCLLAGIFITADSLSSEKREGTLGLLFLTDLKGHDVVLGKFLAMSLNAFYGLLATLPVLGLPLLLGGVTGAEFWRVALALINVLFFSLTAGIWVSAISRESHKAMGQTLLVILLICVAPLLIDLAARSRPNTAFFSLASPLCAYISAYESSYLRQPASFWWSLMISNLIGWAFLGRTCWVLPHAWQDRPLNARMRNRQTIGATPREEHFVKPRGTRAKLLDTNPVLWLAGNDARVQTIVWLLTVLIAGGFVSSASIQSAGPMITGALSVPVTLAMLALKALFGVQACRFFVETRRNGALELLLSTPLTTKQIIDGQWLALRRIFLWPVIIILVAQLVSIAGQFMNQYYSTATQAMPAWLSSTLPVGLLLYGSAKFVADLFAVGWFGMWLALYLKNPNTATGLTLLYVLVLPAFLFFVPDVIIDIVIIAVVRNKLLQGFRELAIRQFAPAAAPLTANIGRHDPNAPPVIAS